jgi:hypothetical protein
MNRPHMVAIRAEGNGLIAIFAFFPSSTLPLQWLLLFVFLVYSSPPNTHSRVFALELVYTPRGFLKSPTALS